MLIIAIGMEGEREEGIYTNRRVTFVIRHLLWKKFKLIFSCRLGLGIVEERRRRKKKRSCCKRAAGVDELCCVFITLVVSLALPYRCLLVCLNVTTCTLLQIGFCCCSGLFRILSSPCAFTWLLPTSYAERRVAWIR